MNDDLEALRIRAQQNAVEAQARAQTGKEATDAALDREVAVAVSRDKDYWLSLVKNAVAQGHVSVRGERAYWLTQSIEFNKRYCKAIEEILGPPFRFSIDFSRSRDTSRFLSTKSHYRFIVTWGANDG